MLTDKMWWLLADNLAVFQSGVRKLDLKPSVQRNRRQHRQVSAVPLSLLWTKTERQQTSVEPVEVKSLFCDHVGTSYLPQTRDLSFHQASTHLVHTVSSKEHYPQSSIFRAIHDASSSFLTYADNESFIFCSGVISDASLARCKSKHIGFYSALVYSQIPRYIYSPVHKPISKHIYESPERTHTHASDLGSMTGYNEPRRHYQGIANMPADLACS